MKIKKKKYRIFFELLPFAILDFVSIIANGLKLCQLIEYYE